MINLIGRSIGFNWKKHRLPCKERESQGQTALTAGIASNDGVYENWVEGFQNVWGYQIAAREQDHF
ncbi:hypothetical protein [uncultured Agathobaculum sp.]|uniref:hypothetical protein n=1 Tax=uncultured Agathobaculum sp. TaxID=2048140 RepID=UPI00320B27AB